MKTSPKGFIAPLLLALAVVLLIGGGAYEYVQNKQSSQSATITPVTSVTVTGSVQSPPSATQAIPAVQQENLKTYSTHLSIKAYLQGPSEIATNTVWSGSVIIPQNTINVAGAPDVMWGDGTADPEWGGSPWKYDATGSAAITHTYKKAGSYTITIYINGGAGVGFEQGTVVIKKTITVR